MHNHVATTSFGVETMVLNPNIAFRKAKIVYNPNALRKAKIAYNPNALRKAKIVYNPIALRKAKIVYNFGLLSATGLTKMFQLYH